MAQLSSQINPLPLVKKVPFITAALTVLLLSCGGGDSPLTPRQMADNAEARARSLLQVEGCFADTQCGYVTFQTPFYSCSQGEHAPAMLLSADLQAAQVAAEEQRYWAEAARALEPPPNFGCAAFVEPPPIPVCSQSQCMLRSGFIILQAAPR
jgi:hypothetical protein